MNIEKLWGLWSARIEADKAVHKDAFVETVEDWLASEKAVAVNRTIPSDAATDAAMAARQVAYRARELAKIKDVIASAHPVHIVTESGTYAISGSGLTKIGGFETFINPTYVDRPAATNVSDNWREFACRANGTWDCQGEG